MRRLHDMQDVHESVKPGPYLSGQLAGIIEPLPALT